ncbi:hypothetical protein PR003_g8481 [Phytophthora rubi]|uniref:Uncharacterized protein n=1 Tax=Phytophthora rubi TaxID=129364 RepID=A0A6A4FXF8_9STRA|nr:hypothetical protein PR002_g8225 [Phytophthora rubi]KAE9037223.1 hypothetical protein PR001_g8461 [Phytophthora rubi]KAE9344408.1 hypothetical protein PR003_g8481 [Phytophthora rubi]
MCCCFMVVCVIYVCFRKVHKSTTYLQGYHCSRHGERDQSVTRAVEKSIGAMPP